MRTVKWKIVEIVYFYLIFPSSNFFGDRVIERGKSKESEKRVKGFSIKEKRKEKRGMGE